MVLEFQVDRKNKIRFSSSIKKFYWTESETSRNINLVCPMGMQERYKSLAISKGLAHFDELYHVSKPKPKPSRSSSPKQKKSMVGKGEFFIKI